MGKWHSVSEKLPIDCDTVLGWGRDDDGGGVLELVVYYEGAFYYEFEWGSFDGSLPYPCEISHWRELPDGPEGC